MSRRFYLRPVGPPVRSAAVRHSYPRWFIPALVIIGASLGLMTYRLTCISSRNPEPTVHESIPRTGTPVETSEKSAMSEATDTDRSRTMIPENRRRSFEGLRIQVLNGCGVKGLAKIITPSLRSYGFDVRETRNASHFSYQSSAIIDRTGDLGMARMVADSLGISVQNVSSQAAPNLVDIDLTLIVGADYRRLRLNLGKSTQE